MATKKTSPESTGTSPLQAFKNSTMTVGNTRTSDYPPVKTSGIKIRGTGAATKGVTARGPMA